MILKLQNGRRINYAGINENAVENFKYIDDQLIKAGYGYIPRLAILGNIQQESKGNPLAISSNGAWHGIIQWNKDRYRLQNRNAQDELQRQTALLLKELEKTGWSGATWEDQVKYAKAFKDSTDLRQAVDMFTRRFVRPANIEAEINKRLGHAQRGWMEEVEPKMLPENLIPIGRPMLLNNKVVDTSSEQRSLMKKQDNSTIVRKPLNEMTENDIKALIHNSFKYQRGGNLSKEQNKEINDGITWMENWLKERKNLLEENSIFTSTDNELQSQLRNLYQTEYKDVPDLSSNGLYESRTPEKESSISIKHWYPETVTHEQTHALEANPQVEAIKKLMEDGKYLAPEVKEFWRLMKEAPEELSEDAIEQYGKYGQDYWDDPNEIYARRNAALRIYGKDPNYKYTKKDLEKMIDILFDNNLDQYDDEFLLHLFNDVASNDKIKINPNFAKLGGLLKYQKGGTVASLWQQHTGLSWKDVDKYVSGLKHTAEDNEKLRSRILSGEFDKLKVTNSNKPVVTPRKPITVPQLKSEPNNNYYTVKAGDNLSVIAKRNNLTLQQLLKLNPQYRANPDKIKIGDQIVINSDEKAVAKRRNIKQLREQEASYKTNLDVILASRHDSNFGVVDKDKQTLTVYDKDKNILARVPVNTGASNLDYNTKTYTQGNSRNGRLLSHLGNESTPAGITEITSVSTYHGVPAFQRSRVGNDNKVNKVFDKTTNQWVDDNVSSSMHFENGVGIGNNRSNGCIRLSQSGAVTLGKYLGVGDRIYTLPQKEGSRFTLRDGNLSFTADNVYGKNKGEKGNSFSYNGRTYDKFDWDDYNVTNNRTYQPLSITANTSGNKTYDTNVNSFKSSLETNKENLQKQLNLSSSEYNSLAMLAMGIAQQESKFGTSKKYKAKQTSVPTPIPWINQLRVAYIGRAPLQKIVKILTNDKSANSEGIAQIKYGDDSDEIRNIYSNIGVTDDHTDVGNEAKAVIARLAHIYKNQYLGDKRLYDAAGMSMEEALAYLYNGGKRDLIATNVNDVRNATKLSTTSWINRLIGKKTEVPLLDYSNKILANSDKFGYYTEYKSGGVIKKKEDKLVYKSFYPTTSSEDNLKEFLEEKQPSYPVQPIYIKQIMPIETTEVVRDPEHQEEQPATEFTWSEKDLNVLNTDGSNQDKQRVASKYLQENLGLTKEQAAALVGIWQAESNFNLRAVNQAEKAGKNSAVKASQYGIGIGQWTHSRHDDFVNYINAHGGNYSLKNQLDFAIDEIKTKYPEFLSNLKNASNVREATGYAYVQYVGANERNIKDINDLEARITKVANRYMRKHVGLYGKATNGFEQRLKFANNSLNIF